MIDNFENHLDQILGEIRALMVDRHAKYGNGNISEFGETGLLVRMGDKYARLKNGHETDFSDESVDDTLFDSIGYPVIWLLWRRGLWPGSPERYPEPPF